jgi:hypothetical protein
MKHIFLVLFFTISLLIPALADNIVKETGYADEEVTYIMSRAETEKRAEERATVDALERAFGKAIIQGNATYIENINSGSKVETHTGFNMISNTYVKGEVIEVLDKKFEEIKGTKIIDGKKVEFSVIKCSITVKAREYEEPPIEFTYKVLGCENEKCETFRFKNDDQMYISFHTPYPGYVAIYMDDNKNASILLPYELNRDKFPGGFPVEAGKDYIFFSKSQKNKNPDVVPDELQLFTESAQELDRIFILYSKNPIVLAEVRQMQALNPEIRLPYSTPSEVFQEWLVKSKLKNRVSVAMIDITVTKK